VGRYESYAIDVLQVTFGDRFTTDDTVFSFGPDVGTGQMDGAIDGRVAVEIGVSSPKQVRACILDLTLSPHPRKLLVVVDTPAHPTERIVRQAGRQAGRQRRSSGGPDVLD